MKFFFFCAAFSAMAINCMAQPQLRQNTVLETTFEGSNYLSGWFNSQHCCDYSVQQTSDKVKAGSSALRLEVRSTDNIISGSIRSEITQNNDPMNEDRWFGFSMYLQDWSDDDAGEHVFQWHPENSTGTATMALWTTGGRFTYVTNPGTVSNTYTDIGPLISNEWVDFVIHVKWASDTTGLLQVWLNGNLVIDRQHQATASGPSYFKLGINKFGWLFQPSTVTRRILYFDEVRIGGPSASYNDIAPFHPKRDYFGGL